MALSMFSGSNSSFSTRFYILALIALVLLCFCSYCSSSSVIDSPVINMDSLSGDIDEIGNDDENSYLMPIQLPSRIYIDVPEQPISPLNNRFLHLLIKSALNQPDYRHNKRYSSQAFHAMRG